MTRNSKQPEIETNWKRIWPCMDNWTELDTINTDGHYAVMRKSERMNATSVMPNHVRFVERGNKEGRIRKNRVTPRETEHAAHGRRTNQYNEGKLESELIRQKWRLQQQQMKAHERRKKILIKEYEIQRDRRLKQLTENKPLFKGPEGMQINRTELCKIKIDIYRKIPGKSAANELQRDIANPEDVEVKRRAGEGSKPIFEREELTRAVSNAEDVEEHRTVATVKAANLENKPQTFERRSTSLSLTRNRSQSHRQTPSRHSRHEDYKHNDRENRRSKGDRGRIRERKEDKRRTQSYHARDEKRLNERNRDPSRSRERDQTKLDRNSHDSNFPSSKSIRGRSGQRKMPSQQIPIPIYYGNFLPRPIMVGPLVPIHGHVAFGGSRCPTWLMRPFRPRFPSRIDMFRLRPPGYPRGFGPQY